MKSKILRIKIIRSKDFTSENI